MAERLHPGVFVEEVPSEVRPIEGVGTSTAAFVGIAEKGPIDNAVFITNWTEYRTRFGSFIKEGDLAYAVYHFFLNGGKKCYVIRVNHGTADSAFTLLKSDQGVDTLRVEAASPGTWGNKLQVSILPGTIDPEREFSMKVWDNKELVEQYQDLSMIDDSDNYVERVINRTSNYIKVEDQDLSDRATFRGTIDLTNGVNLLNVKYINLQIDDIGPFDINCAEPEYVINPEKVTRSEIIEKINTVFEKEVAFEIDESDHQYIELRSPSTGAGSQIIFEESGIPDLDATEDIFGVVEYSWVVTQKEGGETIVKVHGVVSPALPQTGELKIALADAPDYTSIVITGVEDLAALINLINDPQYFPQRLATSNGTHLWLHANEDIRIKKSVLTNELFGEALYSIAEYGSAGTAAEFVGTEDLASLNLSENKMLNLKIDNYPVMQIDLNAGIDLDGVIETINTYFKDSTHSRKNIAKKQSGSGSALVLTITSPTKGEDSRVVVSYSGEKDAGVILFGTKISNFAGDYEFIAEEYENLPARIIGREIDSVVTFPGDKTHIRFSANDSFSKDVDFGAGNLNPLEIAAKINSEFKDIAWIDYSVTGKAKVALESPIRGANSKLYFSIPLDLNLVHQISLHALDLLFDVSEMGEQVATPNYIKTILPPNNRPQLTINLIDDTDIPKYLTGGTQDHENVDDTDILQRGLPALDTIDDVNLICIPGNIVKSEKGSVNVLIGGMAYCESRSLQDCFFIADIPQDKRTPKQAQSFIKDDLPKKSDYAAIYYPWVKVSDPIGTSKNEREIPPSGLVAGMYAKIDATRGVWKAPAGTESNLSGALALSYKSNDSEHDLLNPFGINCIRQFPGSGIVIWGSRTLGLKSKPEWKYIPVRRMAIFLRVSIYNGIQWAVFEPNDEDLWASLRLNIGSFMMRLFRQGAFQGDTPSKAFFVKCDAETTTQADIDAGTVNILVGFAPLKPAEFVVVKISQKAGQSAM